MKYTNSIKLLDKNNSLQEKIIDFKNRFILSLYFLIIISTNIEFKINYKI